MIFKKVLPPLLCILIFVRSSSQVNLQTGSATFSLPMFSWQDDKSRLTSIVALSYNSGNGLRVNEIASNAGQGWNLVAGGQIVRLQNGLPDDQVARNGNGTEYDVTRYPPGILYATVPAVNGCPLALTKYPIYGWKNQVYTQHNVLGEDKELDYFSFQFNGKVGMFVLDLANPGVAKTIGDSKMKLSYQEDASLINQGIRTKITSFTIQDGDGLIYHFTAHGLTKILKTEFSDDSYNHLQKAPKIKNDKVYYESAFDGTFVNPWVINNWLLTEIVDPLTQRHIVFNYTQERSIANTAGEDISSDYARKNYCIVSHKLSIQKELDLSSIVYPDGHSVTINYNSDKPRIDLIGEYPIASVDITYQSRFLSKYLINTSYFILNRYGYPLTNYERRVSRLCLRSVQKIGVDLKEDTPPYFFDYYMGSSGYDVVPPPFFHMKDVWGFYNGDNSIGYLNDHSNNPETMPLHDYITDIKSCNYLRGLCFRRYNVSGTYLNTKSGYAKNGLLRQIVYPTGGTLSYQYGQNTGVLNSSTVDVGGVHVSQTSSTDGGNSNSCSVPIVTNYNYTLNGGASSMWGLEMPINSMSSFNHYQPEYKDYKYSVPFGECYWHFANPGILTMQQAVDLTGLQKIMQMLSPVLQILNVIGTISDISAAFSNSPVGLIIDVVVGLLDVGLTCIGDQSRDTYATVYLNSDLNASSPLPVQFKRVEVTEGNGSNGKTIQEFTSDDDYSVWATTNPTYSAKQRFAPWAYGLPKRTVVYDVNGYPVKETINSYSYGESEPSCYGLCPYKDKHQISDICTKCYVVNQLSQRNTDWEDPNLYNASNSYITSSASGIGVDQYRIYSGRVELKTTLERAYKPSSSSEYLETATNYVYNGDENYEPKEISTTQSNGDINYKYIKYPADYSGSIITTLLQNNINSIPIAISTAVKKNGTSTIQYLTEKVTEFSSISNGDIKPYKILEQRFSQPQSSFTPYPGPGGSTSNYKIPQVFTYDANGNLIGLKDEGNRTVSNIYDYDDKEIVAVIINADPANDKTSYTSFETSSTGGWTLSGAAAYSTSAAMTGTRSFVLSSGKSFTGSSLNTSRSYTVSFWSTSSSVTASGGATLIKSAPTINGFTYYEYDIAQGTSSVTVSGSGTVDELRLYPKTSRMRTTTYDPLIGKTSDCDENNRITYYEYDNLGRLRFEKDEHGNIVKMHEYNNVSTAKQNGCPGTYYNRLISEVFVRNNCSSGQQGSQVEVTVPANTYSSAISQEDADAQAEQWLLANAQTYANTNGTCLTIYYNAQVSITDTTENCPIGYVGGPVTYTVAAGTYSSTTSQADADELAMDDIDANAQVFANDPSHANCIYSTDPDWVWPEGGNSQCQWVNSYSEYHLFVYQTDMNPNSSTYLQHRWTDTGPNASCPSPSCTWSTCGSLGEGHACINDNCETGVRINTECIYHTETGLYECIYHYEFSDYSWSQNYSSFDVNPCEID